MGRGFAVVADEVRKLAERSKDTAHRVQSVLGSLSSRISDMHARASEAGTVAAEVKASVETFHQRFATLAEQSDTVLGQVQRVRDMSQVSLQKSAMSCTSRWPTTRSKKAAGCHLAMS
jgi:methyl-accepting chemotaxis protein